MIDQDPDVSCFLVSSQSLKAKGQAKEGLQRGEGKGNTQTHKAGVHLSISISQKDLMLELWKLGN